MQQHPFMNEEDAFLQNLLRINPAAQASVPGFQGPPAPYGPPSPTPTISMKKMGKNFGGQSARESASIALEAAGRAPQSAADYLQNLQIAGLERQREGLSSLEQKYNEANAGAEEMNPWMAAVTAISDFYNKGNMLGKYTERVQTGKDRRLAGEANLQKYREGISDKEIELLKLQANKESDEEKFKTMIKVAGMRGAAGDGKNIGPDVLKTKESQKLQAQLVFDDALSNYENLLDQHGISVTGANKDEINAAYANLKIRYKEAAQLGALTGPDLEIIVDALQPATGMKGAVRQASSQMGIGAGVEGLKAGIGQLRKTSADDFDTTISALDSAYGPNTVTAGYRQRRTTKKDAPQSPASSGKKPHPSERYKK